MNTTEYLLTKLAEECVEVAQRADKALCFGSGEIQQGQSLTNAERIILELADLQGVIEMLAERGIIDPTTITRAMIDAKRAKLLRFMAYSRECGALQDDGGGSASVTTALGASACVQSFPASVAPQEAR